MRRGTIFLGIFVIFAAAIVAYTQFLQNQPPLEITITVDPLAETWMRQAVNDFNNSETVIGNSRRVRVNLNIVNDIDVWNPPNRNSIWEGENHPDGWMPSSSASLRYATGYPFQTVQPSTARTPIIFGGYASRVDILTDAGAQNLDWQTIIDAAETESWQALGGNEGWRFVKLAFPLADSTMSGLGVLYSGAASISGSTQLARDNLSIAFQNEFAPVVNSVSNFNTMGADIAAFVARGPTSADIGIAPESQWLNNLSGLVDDEPIRFSYPTYVFILDFPLAVWQDPQLPASDERAAVEAFGNWLLQPAQQSQLPRYGLRPAASSPTDTDRLFADAQQYGIQLNPTFTNVIQAPTLNDTQSLISWFSRERS